MRWAPKRRPDLVWNSAMTIGWAVFATCPPRPRHSLFSSGSQKDEESALRPTESSDSQNGPLQPRWDPHWNWAACGVRAWTHIQLKHQSRAALIHGISPKRANNPPICLLHQSSFTSPTAPRRSLGFSSMWLTWVSGKKSEIQLKDNSPWPHAAKCRLRSTEGELCPSFIAQYLGECPRVT